MLTPIALGIITACLIGPESPSWLALKNRYEDCSKTFKWLRGDDAEANKELLELLNARKEVKEDYNLFKAIVQRDFYIPAALMFLLLHTAYWSGVMVLIVYSPLIMKKATNDINLVHYSVIILNIILILAYINCAILMNKFSNKVLILIGAVGVVLSSLFCCVITSLENLDVEAYSILCLCGLAFFMFLNLGFLSPTSFVMAMEITAVKHRGIGGALYLIFSSLLHFSSLKLAPYMFVYINLWGTFLVYSINTAVGGVLIWKFVPETKNRTLQEIEDFFNNGKFIKRCIDEAEKPMVGLDGK